MTIRRGNVARPRAGGIHHLYLLRGDAIAAADPTVVSVDRAVVSRPYFAGGLLRVADLAAERWSRR